MSLLFDRPDIRNDRIVFLAMAAFLRPGDLAPGAPGQQRYWQQLADLPVERLNAGKLEEIASRSGGWRYIIGDRTGNALNATIEFSGTTPGVRDVSRGPAANAAFRAAQDLKTLPEAAEHDYTAWVLTVPALYTEAFWLMSKDGSDDLVVPFLTAQDLRVGYPYKPETFLKVLRTAAGKIGKFPPSATASSDTEARATDPRQAAEQRRAKIEARRARQQQEAIEDKLAILRAASANGK